MPTETRPKHLVAWHGSKRLALELRHVLRQHCTCDLDESGTGCASHGLLFNQRAVDGLLFGRWLAVRLLREEFQIET
jgi:hypothetical protein